MRVVIGAGNARKTAMIEAKRDARREAGKLLKRFLFPGNGAYHKAHRRGERALNNMVPA